MGELSAQPRGTGRLAGFLSAVSAAAVLAGCGGAATGSGSGVATSEPDSGAAPRVVTTAGLRLPLDDFVLSESQVSVLDQARLLLIDRCMRRFGRTYVVSGLERRADPSANPLERRYGITDDKAAARNGYGVAATAAAHPVTPKLDADGETALWGRGSSTVSGVQVPTGGCVGEANRGLASTAPAQADINLGQQLSVESYNRSRADSRVKAVTQAWSACMTTGGYDYTDPLAPLADPRFGSDGRAGDARAVARLDIGCKQRVNLVGVWFSIESAYQRDIMARNQSRLAATRAAIRGELTVAEATVRQHKR